MKKAKKGLNHEVEVRFLVKDKHSTNLMRKILEAGFKFVHEEKLKDLYFCDNKIKKFAQVEMDEIGSYSLRLRNRKFREKETNELNIKVITKKSDHNAWDEHEVEVSSLEEMKKILERIGYKIFFTLTKRRRVFKKGDCSILVEDINNLGLAVEIEIVTKLEKADETKQRIFDLMESLGYDKSQKVPKSITNLLMKKYSVF